MSEYKSILKNSESIARLAKEQIDSWNSEDMRYYAISKMEDYYSEIPDEKFDDEFMKWWREWVK